MHRFILFAAALITFAALCGTAVAAEAGCKIAKVTVAKDRADSCTLTRRMTVVTDPVSGHKTEVHGETLSCGKLRLGSWKRVLESATDSCTFAAEEGAEMDYDINESFSVVSRSGRYVTVDIFEGGFSGGAHPSANLTRRTFDTRTGRGVSLARVIGKKKATKVLAVALQRFEEDAETTEGYAFDSMAFEVSLGEVTFAMPHAYEIVRGTTYDISVDIP